MLKISLMKFIFAALFTAAAAALAGALDENELSEKIRALDWQAEPGKYQLVDINASLTTLPGERLLMGEGAHEFMRMLGGREGYKPDAVVFRLEGESLCRCVATMYSFRKAGFFKLDDWNKVVDKDSLLEKMRENTEEANKTAEKDCSKLYIDGWVQEPYLDETNAILYGAVLAHNGEGVPILSARALKLGREGYMGIAGLRRLTTIADARTSLSQMLETFQFDEGYTYADFSFGAEEIIDVRADALMYEMFTGKAARGISPVWLLLAAFGVLVILWKLMRATDLESEDFSFSFWKGANFNFRLEDGTAVLFTLPQPGKQRVKLGERVISASWSAPHEFQHGGNKYRIAFEVDSYLCGPWKACLYKNGALDKAYIVRFERSIRLFYILSLPVGAIFGVLLAEYPEYAAFILVIFLMMLFLVFKLMWSSHLSMDIA